MVEFCDHANRSFLRAQKPCFQQHKRRSEAQSARLRAEMLKKYGAKCTMCRKGLTAQTMHVDHVIPFARGGYDGPSNWMPLCGPCNKQKAANVIRVSLVDGKWTVDKDSGAPAQTTPPNRRIKATPSGTVYHDLGGCARKTASETTKEEARRRKLTPCKICCNDALAIGDKVPAENRRKTPIKRSP